MATLEEQKITGLLECEEGICERNKKKAISGIDKFIQASLREMELERIVDEADIFGDDWDNENEKTSASSL